MHSGANELVVSLGVCGRVKVCKPGPLTPEPLLLMSTILPVFHGDFASVTFEPGFCRSL